MMNEWLKLSRQSDLTLTFTASYYDIPWLYYALDDDH